MKNTLFKSSGPFGGREGCQWDDGIYTTIRQLIIYSSSVIENIQIEYDEKGRSDWSKKHGESESGMINTVKLDYPGEYLRSITGHYSTKNQDIIVFSLTIESNRRTYGPFGTEEGDCFKFPPTSGNKIIGFHGSSGYYLNSIGAYFQPFLDPGELITTEPFGGRGGNQWDDGIYTTIRQLIIFSSWAIDSIQIEYDEKGESKWSNRPGRKHGTKSTIKLDYPGEFLISVSGYFFNHHLKVVESLTIESNRSTYGPFGPQDETYFKFPSTSSGKIIGFHGRSGRYIDSIGAYIKPILDPGETTCPISPFGGVGGSSWDDGVHSTIRKLIIFTSEVISSIQIEYDDKGQSNWSATHGIEDGTRNVVELEYPDEFLISVSGYIREYPLVIIQSFIIESNKRTYGPFGNQKKSYFKFPSISGKIIGFHGNCGDYLDSIGAYIEPILDPGQSICISPFGGKGGSSWNDGVHSTVRRLVIFTSEVIESIQIEYDDKGQSNWSETHGSERGTRNTVTLDYPNEFILLVSGHLHVESSLIVVGSLKFESNKGTYGPFGTEAGRFFKFPSISGKIIGFHGRCSDNLDSIGAYFEPLPNP